jgi:hypothetical protein
METEFRDWENIKSIVREHGASINQPGIAKGFLEHYDQEHLQLSSKFGDWIDLYTEIINKLLRVYPDMKLKDLLDDDGSYCLLENRQDNINITLGEKDSELIERLKEIIEQTSHKLPNT